MGNKEISRHHHAHNGEDPEAPPQLPPAAPHHGYQPVPASACHVAQVGEDHLPCCGCGYGWFMFIIGFFLATFPWYIATFILICGKVPRREKPGYIACTILAVGVTVAFLYVLYRLLPHLIPLIMSLFGI